MADNRRRQYYVDRLFQRRFIMVFLLIAFLMAVGNLLYYSQVLRPGVEALMYRSHIPIDNPAAMILQHITGFSVVMMLSVLVLVIGLYTIMRIRLKEFTGWLLDSIREVRVHSGGPYNPCPREDFEDLGPVLDRFFEHVSDQQVGRSLYVSALVRCLEAGSVSDMDVLARLKRDAETDSE